MKTQSSIFLEASSGTAVPSVDYFGYQRQADTEISQERAPQPLWRITAPHFDSSHNEWTRFNFLFEHSARLCAIDARFSTSIVNQCFRINIWIFWCKQCDTMGTPLLSVTRPTYHI